ncbi:hypothetical protein G8C92_31090, partial [Paenibacillus donghaensis]|uniref:hypothetical protein n=1 Tax=Paenibacillus donghaensis TaxID=414771 RepID=UPI003A0FEE06|nr:hypothetical protein [Paenibacillus donghaensis]
STSVPIAYGFKDFSDSFCEYPGEATIASAFVFVGATKKSSVDIAKIAKNYTLKDVTFKEHILALHGPTSKAPLKSKFNGAIDIRKGIDDALR